MSEMTTFLVPRNFLCISLPSLHDYDMRKMSISRSDEKMRIRFISGFLPAVDVVGSGLRFLLLQPVIAKLLSTGQPFSEENMEAHPTIQKLAKCIDLEHTCGFITMLKPSIKKQAANARRRTISANFGMPSPAQSNPQSLSPLIVINDTDSSTDSASEEQNEEDGADPLSYSSVDDMVVVGKEKTKEAGDESAGKWLPLDLCYGLPLFDGDLSKQVYQKVTLTCL